MNPIKKLGSVFCWLWYKVFTRVSRALFYVISLIVAIAIIVGLFSINQIRYISLGSGFKYGNEYFTRDSTSGGALVLSVSGEVVDRPNESPWILDWFPNLKEELSFNIPTAYNIVKAIKYAKNDSSIKGIYLDLSDTTFENQEIVESIGMAIKDFRKSGKTVIAYSLWYDNMQYLLASYADQVYTSNFGNAVLESPLLGSVYVKGTLDKFGAKSYATSSGEFTIETDRFTKYQIDDKAKAFYQSNFDKHQALVDLIAKNLNIAPEKIDLTSQQILDFNNQGISENDYLIKNGALDGALSIGELETVLADKFGVDRDGDKIKGVFMSKYISMNELDNTQNKVPKEPYIASYVLSGVSSPHASDLSSASYNPVHIADDITRIANDNDTKVKAIVLKVNSIGGDLSSAYSLDTAIQLAKSKNIPVYVSVSDSLASSAYLAVSSANEIYVNDFSLVGAMGISYKGLINVNEYVNQEFSLYPDFSTNTVLRISPYAAPVNIPFVGTIFDIRPYDKKMQEFIQATTDGAYKRVKYVVTSNRKLNEESSNLATNGKVYLGEEAVKVGLADQVGNYDAVIDHIHKDLGDLPVFIANGLYNNGINVGTSFSKFFTSIKIHQENQLLVKAGLKPIDGQIMRDNLENPEKLISICTTCYVR